MGLDMYAFSCTTKLPRIVPADTATEIILDDNQQIAYWRKHPNLHGWMHKLFKALGGTSPFNCDFVTLTFEDLDRLEDDITKDRLPHTEGFFFGTSSPEDKQADLEFITKAREDLAAGRTVYYTSWW